MFVVMTVVVVVVVVLVLVAVVATIPDWQHFVIGGYNHSLLV